MSPWSWRASAGLAGAAAHFTWQSASRKCRTMAAHAVSSASSDRTNMASFYPRKGQKITNTLCDPPPPFPTPYTHCPFPAHSLAKTQTENKNASTTERMQALEFPMGTQPCVFKATPCSLALCVSLCDSLPPLHSPSPLSLHLCRALFLSHPPFSLILSLSPPPSLPLLHAPPPPLSLHPRLSTPHLCPAKVLQLPPPSAS